MEDLKEENIAQQLPENCHTLSSSEPSTMEVNVPTHHQEMNFSSPTPVKTKEPSRIKCKDPPDEELPENYRILSEFYDRMTTSLRLLSLCKRTPTFQNVRNQVEILTRRKFLLTHLAQMKYVLPEAVQIDKILIHDEKTKCMKPDLKIALLFDVVYGHCEESVFVALNNLFSSRLKDFFVTHPEDTNVPEAVLPEPFNQRSITFKGNPVPENLSASCVTESLNSSHLSPSFRKCFYQKAAVLEMEKTNLLSPLKSDYVLNEDISRTMELPDSSSEPSMPESTPTKLAPGSGRLLVDTPMQSTPMRSISPNKSVLTCEDENKMIVSQNGKQPASTVKKSLDFYCLDGEDSNISLKETSVCLSDLVLLIHKIFQSVNFYPITKEELIQKIILHNCDIEDHSEVEPQIERLEKLVPDWFYKKLASSGDLLYNVKKASDLNLVCERINVI